MDLGTIIGEALNPRANAEKLATCGCATEHPTLEEWETVHGAVELHASHRTTVLSDEGREVEVTPRFCTCPASFYIDNPGAHSVACPLSSQHPADGRFGAPAGCSNPSPASGALSFSSVPVPSTHPQRRSAVTGHLGDRPSDRPVADPCRR